MTEYPLANIGDVQGYTSSKQYSPLFKPYIQYHNGKLCVKDLIQDEKHCVAVIKEGTCYFCS